MNEKKIAFIICVKNTEQYEKMLKYLSELKVPKNYEAEIITITEEKNTASAYNQAVNVSDAKYKVYINEKVYIQNDKFLEDFLMVFKKNTKLGMLGVAGTKAIPTSAICLDSKKRCGKIFTENLKSVVEWDTINDSFEIVQAIDGFIMITQYDIPWREDLFNGNSFYDIAQSVEFKKNEYEVAVINQKVPWCALADLNFEYEEIARQVFLDVYSKDVFPLVSILIPTYNRPEYFEIALQSALNQTYRHIEVIIGDGSTDNYTETLMKKYTNDKRIIYFHKDFSEVNELWHRINKRWEKIFNDSRGEYINWLMDDDYFHIEKIEKMMDFYLQYEDITLVTSHRQLINEKGIFMKDMGSTAPICKETKIFPGDILGREMLKNIANFIGEPTTVLIKKSNLTNGYHTHFLNYSHKTLFDVNYWLDLLSKGRAVYICDTLSYFRFHCNQDQRNVMAPVTGLLDWYNLIWLSYQAKKFLVTEEDYKISLKNMHRSFSQSVMPIL